LEIDQLKRRLVETGRILEREGQGDWTRGHVSARHPESADLFLMKASRIGVEEMTPDNIITLDLEGTRVTGTHPRHNEVYIHSEIYRARPDVRAVIHTHPFNAVVFSALGKPLQPIGQPGAVFSAGLPIFDETTELINTKERGAAVARCLGRHKALILQNHGIVTAAESVEEALYLALSLEHACQMQILAEAAGGAKALGHPKEIAAKRAHMLRPENFRTTFDYLARRTAATSDRPAEAADDQG
jgi:L-fuculose-phosphate aldolase